ncbi:hypothetical protein [Alkalihalobacterium alkalinitrilicum]|uniref:hypothetical protein n=1 Tax=Alkalihalobacterium alkalinitrilicum TaxID=427920 RepID=UPI000994D186|nr:hypothetical protein [Alkalihalobacterium alkalinitrilicum]
MNKPEEDSSSTQHKNSVFSDEFNHTLTHPFSKKHSSLSTTNTVQLPIQMMSTDSIPHTRATFMAFVDAVIPSTLGALDLRLDDFLIWSLDHNFSIQKEWGLKNIQLSHVTAQTFDAAALQLILSGNISEAPNYSNFPEGGPFAALSFADRFEAIHLLENSRVDLESLPSTYRNNIGLVKFTFTNLHQLVMLGYYSEWFSYGATRLAFPEERRIDRSYITWELIQYPGPALGYRDLRGFLVKKFKN